MKKSSMLNLKRINLLLLALIMLIPQLSGIASADTQPASPRFYVDQYFSASFNKVMNYRIYLPQGYDQSDRKYPVVYLLHQEGGLSEQFETDKVNEKLDQWISAGTIQKMIVVMPDTSADSYYVNKPNEPWENLIVNDLVPAIDQKYRTMALPKFRGISGVSMGGFGAVVLAMKHPELFTSVGSLMGDLNNTVSGLKPLTLLKAKTTAEARAYNYYFDGGTDDPFTYATDSTNDFHAYLRTKSAAHGYQTRPGGHTSEYYLKVMDRLFAMHSNSFAAGLVTGSFTASPQAIASTTTEVNVGFTTTLNRTSVTNFVYNNTPNTDYNMSIELAVTSGDGKSILYSAASPQGNVVTGSALATFTGSFTIPVSALTGADKNYNITLNAKLLGNTYLLGTKPLVKVTPTGTLPEDTQIDLLGDWKFIKDSNTPAIPAMNDSVDTSSWSTVQPGFDWWIDGFGGYSGLNNYSGTAWYRKEFFVPADFPNKDLTLMAGKIDDADMTYINGQKVGETGFANGAYTASFWAMSREYAIPENLLKRGQMNVIAIRVYNANGGGGIYSGPMGVYSKAAVQKIKNLPSKVPNQTITDQVSSLIQNQSDAITTRDIKAYRDTISERYFEKGIDKLKLVDKMSVWMSTYSLLSVQIQNPYIFELDGKFLYTAVSTITGTTANGTTSTLSQGTISQYYQYDNGVLKEYGDQKLFYKTEFYSPALGRNNVMRVYLPKSYLTNPDKRYPTIYLFHQLNSDSESYEIDKINEIVDKGIADGTMKDMIIAIPDSAGTSWWVNQTGTNGIKWQDMVIKDLVPYMDLNYRTINDARYRGTTGVSMGGFGSFSMAFQFPELFSTAASHMGAINSTNAGINPTTVIKNYPVDSLKRYSIYFDAGNTDVYKFEDAVNGLHAYLKSVNVPHYAEVRDGAHDSAFYTKSIDLSFAQHSRHFASSNVPNDVFAGSISVGAGSGDRKVNYTVTAAAKVANYADHIPVSPYIAANKQNPTLKIPVIVELYNTTTHAKVYSYRDMFETATANSFTGELAIPKNLDAGTYEAVLKVDLLDSSYEVARQTFAVEYEGSTLVGPATVVSGQAIELTYGLANVTQSVYAKELTVNFDPAKMQYVNAESLKDGFAVSGETNVPGSVRLLVERSTPESTVTGTESLLKLHFLAKAVPQTVTTSVYLSHVVILDANGNDLHLSNGADYQVSVQVDKAALNNAISAAAALTSSSYTASSWGVLQTALTAAISASSNADIAQAQIDSAAANLQSAITGLVIKPVDNLTPTPTAPTAPTAPTETPEATPAPTPAATVKPNGTPAPIVVASTVSVDPNTQKATSTVDAASLNKAISEAKADASGKTLISIEIADVPNAKEYAMQLPSQVIMDSKAPVQIEIKSSIANIMIPSNMFKAGELPAGEVSLVIGKAETSSLNDELKAQIGNHPVIELSVKSGDQTVAWNNSNAPVAVSVAYTPTAEELLNREHIVIWYIDGQGNANPVVNGRYDAATGKVSFTTTHFSTYAVAFVMKSFADITSVEWAKKQIEVLASKGIINGVSKADFKPSNSITRADFMVLLVRVLELNGTKGAAFADVKAGDYYNEALQIARGLGIAEGSGDNQFHPLDSITRQDMMVLTARAMKAANKTLHDSTEGDQLSNYTDNSNVSAYAKASVDTLIKAGLVHGFNSQIQPKAATTRAESAVMLYNLYNQ